MAQLQAPSPLCSCRGGPLAKQHLSRGPGTVSAFPEEQVSVPYQPMELFKQINDILPWEPGGTPPS